VTTRIRRGRRQAALRSALRATLLAAVLGTTAIVVPDSASPNNDFYLVEVERAEGVDLSPDVIWIMAIGSDARPGENFLRTRGDALQLIGINSVTGSAVAFGVPRDSWVEIPGYGTTKINAALSYGGPQAMAGAIRNLIGIEPDYVMVASFEGFMKMVGDIGDITVKNPVAFEDLLAPKGFDKGKIKLNPYRALAFSRARKQLIAGDFDRSANQQRVVRGILAKLQDRADQAGFIEMGVGSVLKNMSTDADPAELFRIAQAIVQVKPGKVTTCVITGGIGNIGGASVVLPNRALAQAYGAQAGKDAALDHC